MKALRTKADNANSGAMKKFDAAYAKLHSQGERIKSIAEKALKHLSEDHANVIQHEVRQLGVYLHNHEQHQSDIGTHTKIYQAEQTQAMIQRLRNQLNLKD
jgi:hypothetical protein